MSEMSHNPGSPTTEVPSSAVTGKAGAWLAKSKQAMKSLERKKVDQFMVTPTACVKLTDMGAAKACVEDLSIAMEADECTRIVRDHKLQIGATAQQDKLARHVFQITVSRGENLYARGLAKPADAFVVVNDTAVGRILKTKTQMNQIDPIWEETFETGISGPKTLEISCFNRSLVGKHDNIGSATFKLDPAVFKAYPCRDLVVPLHPRGTVHISVEMMGHERHDVKFHLNKASRTLDRTGEAMTRAIVDRVSRYG